MRHVVSIEYLTRQQILVLKDQLQEITLNLTKNSDTEEIQVYFSIETVNMSSDKELDDN